MSRLLHRIDGPADLHGLSDEELQAWRDINVRRLGELGGAEQPKK